MKRHLLLEWTGALAIAGASSFSAAQTAPTDWADVEGRIQYAYYTEDTRALNGMLNSLKPKPVEGEDANAAPGAGVLDSKAHWSTMFASL